jgi:hypothetical protein
MEEGYNGEPVKREEEEPVTRRVERECRRESRRFEKESHWCLSIGHAVA